MSSRVKRLPAAGRAAGSPIGLSAIAPEKQWGGVSMATARTPITHDTPLIFFASPQKALIIKQEMLGEAGGAR